MGTVHGAVLHIMQGTLSGTDTWFHNPHAEASAHFGVGKAGSVYQWVDTADKAWAQAAGNPNWISIELEGQMGDSMTGAQMLAVADIVNWLKIPLELAESPFGQGIGYHAMGGKAWGGHPCPGEAIKAQRQMIINMAVIAAQPKDTIMPDIFPPYQMEPIVSFLACPTGGVWQLAESGAVYAWGCEGRGGANGQPYFAGRKAAKLVPGTDGHLYSIISTSNERYDY